MERFREGRRSVSHHSPSRWPPTIIYGAVKEQTDQYIRNNRRISTDENDLKWAFAHRKKTCKNYSRSNWEHFIVMQSVNFGTPGPNPLTIRLIA
jgi:hypothetical protein